MRRAKRSPPRNEPGRFAALAASPRVRAAAIVALVLLAYGPALVRAGFVWDDDVYVVNNPTLKSVGGLATMWLEPLALPQYYPLVHTTFWIEYQFFGAAPAIYHVVNLALHAANAVLLALVLSRLRVPGAWLAAAVFAVHPVEVESVAWVTERKNLLSTFFYLAAALCFFRFLALDTPEDAGVEEDAATRRSWSMRGALLFLASLLSKTVTATLPAALLLMVWWKKKRLAWSDARPMLPLLAVGAAFGLATAWLEKHHVGAEGLPWSFGPGERCLIAARAVWFYAAKIVWPANLTFIYPRWHIDAADLLQWLPVVGVLAVPAGLWALRGRIGTGPLVGALYFGGTLLPALGFFAVYPMRYSFVADHFQYLASVGPIALLAAGIAMLSRRSRSGAFVLGATILAVMTVLTARHARVFRDAETLWKDTIARNPGAVMAYNNLATLYIVQGRYPAALDALTHAVELKTGFVEAEYNLGVVLMIMNRLDAAETHFRETLKLQPDHARAHLALSRVLEQGGRLDEARSERDIGNRLKREEGDRAHR